MQETSFSKQDKSSSEYLEVELSRQSKRKAAEELESRQIAPCEYSSTILETKFKIFDSETSSLTINFLRARFFFQRDLGKLVQVASNSFKSKPKLKVLAHAYSKSQVTLSINKKCLK